MLTSRMVIDLFSFQAGKETNSSFITPFAASWPADVLTKSKSVSFGFLLSASLWISCPATLRIPALEGAFVKSSSGDVDVTNASA